MTEAKVQLGRRLFYDKRLSDNQTMSCASCHDQRLAFTDGLAHSQGATGEPHPRSAMSLANVAYAASLTWANPLFAIGVLREPIERQTMIPMYGDTPVELGLTSQAQIEGRLQAVAQYVDWFSQAFPGQPQPVTAQNINRALAAFERTLISGSSPFDRYAQGLDPDALSESAKRGHALFDSERLACSQCHSGFNFSDHVYYRDRKSIELVYHNTGLYNIDGLGAYPEPNTGVYGVTLDPDEMGMFKAPTLRNIALTAPYMHDGSIPTLNEVIDHYAAGGRTLVGGPHAGVGSDNPYKDSRLKGFSLSAQERADLIAFLMSLTDQAFTEDAAFSDPWL